MGETVRMKPLSDNDARLADIRRQVERFAAGDYDSRLDVAGEEDQLDSLMIMLNQLGDTLKAEKAAIRKQDSKLEALQQALLRYTALDFSQRATIHPEGDAIDALAAGLNVLGEEVMGHVVLLRDSKAQLQTIFKNAPDAIVVIDSGNVIRQWNPAAAHIFGWSEEEVLNKELHTVLVPPEYRQRHLSGIRRFIDTGQASMVNRTIEVPALKKDGGRINVELTISAARVKGQYVFIAFLRDVTERVKAAAEIRQLNATLEHRVLERTRQLHASEAKYRYLFQNNPMALWVLDATTLRFLDVNQSALSRYGYTREEFLSMTSLELRPEEDRERYAQLNRQHVGTQNAGIWRHRKKDGTIIHAEIIAHDMDFEGIPARLILAHDVTEMVRVLGELRLSEARFRRIFESKMVGFMFWDDRGVVTEANELFLDMLRYSEEDLRRGVIRLVDISPEKSEADRVAAAQLEASGVCEPFEKEYVRKDGSRLPVLVGIAQMSDSPAVKGVAFVMDISQRKEMEREILALNRDLEDRIDQRTFALQQANQELESFSYSVSHDLRAPIRAIHGYANMLAEDYAPKLGDEGMRLLKAVMNNARGMGQLVDDLLAFSRMGKVVLSETNIDVHTMVVEIVSELTAKADKAYAVTVHPMGFVRADLGLLKVVFENLIGNAVKYSSKKEQPAIEIGETRIAGQRTWYVKDNGAGFDMTYYDKIFGVFERLHTQAEFEGTGVGLALVRRIVERHGGSVWGEGAVGAGASFYFTLGNR